jgi:dTDP-4-dehydrorhamnose 3,5-epimerase
VRLISTDIHDCYIIEWSRFDDNRGYFTVPFNSVLFKEETGIDFNIVQENESFSYRNVIRGLHFQRPPFEQAKLVRCIYGSLLDVIVDIRPTSPTYGKVVTVQLLAGTRKSVFVPRGCAHGFSTKSRSMFQYKVDNVYNKESEGGIVYNDPDLNINWEIEKKPKVSSKDKKLPFFKDIDIYK